MHHTDTHKSSERADPTDIRRPSGHTDPKNMRGGAQQARATRNLDPNAHARSLASKLAIVFHTISEVSLSPQ